MLIKIGAAVMDIENESKITGEELYRRFLTGDNGAFEEFVKMYEDELSRYIYGIVRDFHETEHLTIETFSQLVMNNKKFDGKSSIKTYLFAIGKNLSFQSLKKRGREQHLSFEDAAMIPADEEESPYNYLEKEDTRHNLHEAIRELKDEYRAVLILLYFEDMSYIQAGRVMRKNEKQIKNLAHRAKAALKKIITDKGFI